MAVSLKKKLEEKGVTEAPLHAAAKEVQAAGLSTSAILALIAKYGPVALEIISQFLKNRKPPAPAA